VGKGVSVAVGSGVGLGSGVFVAVDVGPGVFVGTAVTAGVQLGGIAKVPTGEDSTAMFSVGSVGLAGDRALKIPPLHQMPTKMASNPPTSTRGLKPDFFGVFGGSGGRGSSPCSQFGRLLLMP
jgi:hypothetical protein